MNNCVYNTFCVVIQSQSYSVVFVPLLGPDDVRQGTHVVGILQHEEDKPVHRLPINNSCEFRNWQLNVALDNETSFKRIGGKYRTKPWLDIGLNHDWISD